MMLPERRCSIERQEHLGHVEDAADVDRVDAIEIGALGLQDRADVAHARAVDEDVEPAGVGQHLLRRIARIALVGDVERQRGVRGRSNPLGRRARRVARLRSVTKTRALRGGERVGDGGANARSCAGDQGDFVGQIEHAGRVSDVMGLLKACQERVSYRPRSRRRAQSVTRTGL